jgi:hypothetical protein
VRGGGLGVRGPLLQWFAGLAHPGRAAKLDLGFAPHPGSGTFFVCPQQYADGKSRPNKYRISSKSRLSREFLSSPGYQTRPKSLDVYLSQSRRGMAFAWPAPCNWFSFSRHIGRCCVRTLKCFFVV